jgi:hydroxypyruvate reductase/glycerate 2-kinase
MLSVEVSMSDLSGRLREQARAIWNAGVAAVDPRRLVLDALTVPNTSLRTAIEKAKRIVVVGGGKAGAPMAEAVEEALADRLDRLTGVVNVPAEAVRPLRAIRLHPARPAGTNHPTAQGVAGAGEQLALAAGTGSADLALCLLSGGGSALLPAPAEGITLADKQEVTRLLHASGATINEMNCVRKHLSRYKGGRLAQRFADNKTPLWTLILSDVIGDPLDVIASGPTAPDPTTFADACAVLENYGLRDRASPAAWSLLQRGQAGQISETPKSALPNVHNLVLGNNAHALAAARSRAEALGYVVLDLGSFIEGETSQVALVFAALIRSIRSDGVPVQPPACILSGGETTVTLGKDHGKGGRNQEFVLAAVCKLGASGLHGVVVLSGGTDGEDGPTDAAGALADAGTLARAGQLGLHPAGFLARHDAYAFFDATGDLLRTGLTGTNVMDLRVILLA